MLIRFYQGDELPNATAGFVDEDSGWWAGVQKCGATLALSAALALGASQAQAAQQVFSFHQDDPALTASYLDESIWQNPVAPVGGYTPPQQLWTNDEQTPALSATVDEYFGFNPTFQAQYPVPQFFLDDVIIVPQPVSFQPDEDFWANPVAPFVAQTILPNPWGFDEQTPALSGTVDEYFGFNPLLQMQYTPPLQLWMYDEQTPALSAPSPTPQNYVNTGVNNYVSQQVGEGVEF